MPRLSLWRDKKGNDYKFFDRRISEMFTVGGTDIHVHKYLGPIEQTSGTSPTEPGLTGITSIQDLLFLENRDRKYDTSIYTMRGLYRVNDNDFDLQQFGLFLTGDTIFMVFHLNDMVETMGRKLMVGDVLELPHLKDYYPLDDSMPVALKRYYVVQDANRAAEGFAPTWYPHLWRVKLNPLVDSQEYKDIIDKIAAGDGTTDTIADVLSTYDKLIDINDAVVQRAEEEVPASGYDTSSLYTAPINDNNLPGDATGATPSAAPAREQKIQGYLTGNGVPPNGTAVSAGIAFPSSPTLGDFYLRLDYMPNRLFRYDGSRWIKVEDNVRTSLTPGVQNTTQRSGFVNNSRASYKDALGWDAIKVANVYTPAANAHTVSFTLSNVSPYGTVVTKTNYISTYGVRSTLNGTSITNTTANSSGNLSFTVTNTLTVGDILEYTVYANVTYEKQSLSDALRPTADN